MVQGPDFVPFTFNTTSTKNLPMSHTSETVILHLQQINEYKTAKSSITIIISPSFLSVYNLNHFTFDIQCLSTTLLSRVISVFPTPPVIQLIAPLSFCLRPNITPTAWWKRVSLMVLKPITHNTHRGKLIQWICCPWTRNMGGAGRIGQPVDTFSLSAAIRDAGHEMYTLTQTMHPGSEASIYTQQNSNDMSKRAKAKSSLKA